MFSITGYNLIYSDLRKRGICIYCKPSIQYKVIQNDINFDECIFYEIYGSDESVLLGVCYRSPNSSADNDNNLLNLLNSMSRTKIDNIVIVGHFNYNMINCNLKSVTALSPSATAFLNTINDLFLEQLISEPTVRELDKEVIFWI